jgi:putative hydrolase of the HAD superfamily
MEAFIFDLDNTLVERQETLKSFTQTLYKTHLSDYMSEEEVIQFVVKEDKFGYRDKLDLFEVIVDELPWEAKLNPEQFKDYWYYHFPRHAQPMETLYETLQELKKRNKKIGLITNGKVKSQLTKLDQLKIKDYFDSIVVSEEVGIKKPDIRIFQMALDQLKVKSGESVYIGDHPKNDIYGASQLGIRTVWKQSYVPWDESLEVEPDYKIKKLNEVIGLL